MNISSKLRGHPIYWDGHQWRYVDNDKPTTENWQDRSCGHCKLPNREDGHDACLGELPGASNACCGHGDPTYSYIQFENGITVRGFTIDEPTNGID